MIKKNIKPLLSGLFLVFLLSLPFFVFAQSTVQSKSGIMNKLKTVGEQGGYEKADDTTLATTLGMIVNVVLSLLGIIFIILIIYAGIQWMTAGGNEDAVTKAKGRLKNAIIGLVITVSSYAIWRLIEEYFIEKSGVIK